MKPVTTAARPDNSAMAAELARLRESVERHYRANRTLRGLAGTATDVAVIDLTPHLEPATISQHPRPKPVNSHDWWPAPPTPPPQPLAAQPGFDCLSLAGYIDETVGVSTMGLRGEDLERVVADVAAEQFRNKRFKPVFLTDQPGFNAFVSRGYSFEYVPRFRRYLAPPSTESDAARRALIAAKWGISSYLDRDDKRSRDRDYPPLAQIIRHNADLPRAGHQDRFGWIIETLRLALSTERFDVVEGLASYLLAFFERIGKTQQVAAARVLCRKFIALGELENLRRFLFKNIAQLRKDDHLFTWFAIYCTDAETYLSEFAQLPSGKTNSYYISKRMAVAGDRVLPQLMAATEAATPNANLLLATYFATHGDAGPYKMFVNRSLAQHGAARLSKVSFDGDNILSLIAFEPQPPSRHDDFVTVIMSAFNAKDTIAYAVRSILGQSHRNLELLICDDCSTDETPEILARLPHDPRVRLFRSKGQQGTYGIRNSLLNEARGAYVTFQDADDFAFPDRLARQLDFLKSRGAAAVAAQWYRITPSGEFIFSADQHVARLAVVSLLGARELFERFGPYRSSRVGADTELFERLRMNLGSEAVTLMPSPVLFGLASANSLTRSAGIEATEDGFRSPARRAYAAAAARQRHLDGLSAGAPVDDVLAANGILMPGTGVEPMRRAS